MLPSIFYDLKSFLKPFDIDNFVKSAEEKQQSVREAIKKNVGILPYDLSKVINPKISILIYIHIYKKYEQSLLLWGNIKKFKGTLY